MLTNFTRVFSGANLVKSVEKDYTTNVNVLVLIDEIDGTGTTTNVTIF